MNFVLDIPVAVESDNTELGGGRGIRRDVVSPSQPKVTVTTRHNL